MYWCRLVMETRPFVKGLERRPLTKSNHELVRLALKVETILRYLQESTRHLWLMSWSGIYLVHKTRGEYWTRQHIKGRRIWTFPALTSPTPSDTLRCNCFRYAGGHLTAMSVRNFVVSRSRKLSRSPRSDLIKRRERRAYWSSGSYARLRILRTPFRLAA